MTARPTILVLVSVLLIVTTLATTTGAAVVPAATGGEGVRGDAVSELDTGHSDGTNRTDAQDDGAPPDPETDVLGWENGVWYNESIAIDPADGYNETEIRRVVARSMARVERIRGLEFESTPDVRLISREEYRAFVEEVYGDRNVTTAERLHRNTVFEALYLVGEDESYYADRLANRGSAATAFHVNEDLPEQGFEEGDVAVVVSEDGAATELQEWTLGHELLHYVQNRRFDNGAYRGGPTEEATMVNRSLIEGDATYVGQTYARRCGLEWDCLPTEQSAASGVENSGLVLYEFVPYSNTATLFERVREEGGVEAMNALYDRPPESTEQFLHPERYPDDEPVDVPVEDRSSEAWERLSDVGPDTVGEAGIFVLLYHPSYDRGSTVAIDFQHPFEGARRDPLVRLDYAHPAATGWEGDTLVVYAGEDSAETNETAYVWRSAWEDPGDARQFAAAYRQVLDEYGDPVGDGTYRIPDAHRFGDAVRVAVDGERVTVVNAPTVDGLADVHPVTEGGPPTETRTTRATETTTTGTGTPEATTRTTPATTAGATATEATDGSGAAQPGFGPVVAVVAVLGAVLVLRRRP